MLTCFTDCLGMRRKARNDFAAFTGAEKSELYHDEPTTSRTETVDEVLTLLLNATGPRHETNSALERELRANGWWDELTTKALLAGIEDVLRSGTELSETLKHAFDTALAEAKHIAELAGEFAAEHPIMTGVVCAVVALGVLYLFWPYALELLGFGAEGPIPDSFATYWQSLYPNVPYGSLFAYLQRLAMTLG